MVIVTESIEEMLGKIGNPLMHLYRVEAKADLDFFGEQEGSMETLVDLVFGEDVIARDVIKEAIDNAVRYGNKYDPSILVSLKIFKGNDCWVARVRDSGEGFDYEHVEKTGLKTRVGGGFSWFKDQGGIYVSFENKGTTINIRGNPTDPDYIQSLSNVYTFFNQIKAQQQNVS